MHGHEDDVHNSRQAAKGDLALLPSPKRKGFLEPHSIRLPPPYDVLPWQCGVWGAEGKEKGPKATKYSGAVDWSILDTIRDLDVTKLSAVELARAKEKIALAQSALGLTSKEARLLSDALASVSSQLLLLDQAVAAKAVVQPPTVDALLAFADAAVRAARLKLDAAIARDPYSDEVARLTRELEKANAERLNWQTLSESQHTGGEHEVEQRVWYDDSGVVMPVPVGLPEEPPPQNPPQPQGAPRAEEWRQTLATLFEKVKVQMTKRSALQDGSTEARKGALELLDKARQEVEASTVQYLALPAGPEKERHKQRLAAVIWGLRIYPEDDRQAAYRKEVKTPRFSKGVSEIPPGQWKCNKFVADSFTVGAGTGLSEGEKWDGPGEGSGYPASRDGDKLWPPDAQTLAVGGPMRSLTNAAALKSSDGLVPGAIVSFPKRPDEAHGHTTIYIGAGLLISAKGTGIEVETFAHEFSRHLDRGSVRYFTGTGEVASRR